ncbi:hypothetical protein D5086_023028 [Populus alba]|uniref:Uncharacterized protein n=1 Tax=Populus alba TaxID=43335 RepID=A0ACC4BA51_POPAL
MVKFEIMDEDNSLNIRNWGYYEPTSVKGNQGLQLLSPTMPEKPSMGERSNAIMTNVNGASTHHVQVFQPPDSDNDEMLDQVEESGFVEKENGPNKKRQRANAPKSPKAKKGTRAPRVPKPEGSPSVQRVRSAKKTAEIMINGINMDMSVIPIPVCSCTANPQQCYRWGCALVWNDGFGCRSDIALDTKVRYNTSEATVSCSDAVEGGVSIVSDYE